ncbi:MAG: flippase-like domain-containing protein [Acidobacteriota bacterium]|nr:flippase-like domain-containing protein [Acidobacteriota bacterium]
MSKNRNSRAKKFAPVGIIFAVLGLLLFAYTVRKAGVAQIIDGIQRLGAGFLLILVLSAIRHGVRSIAWTKCFEPPYALRFRDALEARLMGDALGNVIPLASMAVSEPSKAAFVRHRVPLMAGLSALAIENIFYSLSVVLFIFSGMAALLLSFPLPKPVRYAAFGSLIIILIIAPLGYLIIHRQWKFLSGAFTWLGNRTGGRGWIEVANARAQTLEERIYGFYERNGASFLPILGLEICFHVAGVAEVYTTLSFISETVAPTLLTAFILESVNRVINVAFKFVPFRTGVDEYGSGALAKVLGFTRATGVTLAIVRKARDIFWTTIGVLLIIRRGLSLRAAANQSEGIADDIGRDRAQAPPAR